MTERRPPSEQLIDLHLLVVPIESWLGKYSLAYNNVALQSTSAGFIRVYPHASLKDLRDLVEEQLDHDIVPEDYVFLRSVGRCLAIVNQNQEKTLKAKHFLPPVAFSPEIFILQGTHEWISSLRKQTKSFVISGDLAAEDEYRLQSGNYYPREITQNTPRSEQQSEENDAYGNRDISRSESEEFLARSPRENERRDKTPSQASDDNMDPSEMLLENANSKKPRKHLSEQIKERKRTGKHYPDEEERKPINSPRDSKPKSDTVNGKENSPTSSHVTSKRETKNQRSTESNGMKSGIRNKSQNEEIASARSKPRAVPAIQVLHPEVINHSVPLGRLATPTPLPSANVIHSTLRYDEYDGRASENKFTRDGDVRKTYDMEGVNSIAKDSLDSEVDRDHIEAEEDRKKFSEKQAKTVVAVEMERDSGISEEDTNERGGNVRENNRYRKENSPKSRKQNHDDMKRNGEGKRTAEESGDRTLNSETKDYEDGESNGSEANRNGSETNRNGSETNRSSDGETDVQSPNSGVSENGSNLLSDRSDGQREERAARSRAQNYEDMKRKEGERKRLEEEKMRIEEKKKNVENDTMEMMKQMDELLRKKKEEDEKRRQEEEQRKKEEKENMQRIKNEAAELRDKLIKIREQRIEKQKQREGLMKNARNVKSRLVAKRGPETSAWERKYQAEKQRNAILEGELESLKSELSTSQKKLLDNLENKGSNGAEEQKSPRTAVGPSQLNNLKNEVRRLKRDKDVLEADMERTQRKVEIESQRKAAAHQELKELRNNRRVAVAASKTNKDSLSHRTKLSNVDS